MFESLERDPPEELERELSDDPERELSEERELELPELPALIRFSESSELLEP